MMSLMHHLKKDCEVNDKLILLFCWKKKFGKRKKKVPYNALVTFLPFIKIVCIKIQLKVSPFLWESYDHSGSDKLVGTGGTLWHDPTEINIENIFGI